MQPLLKLLRPEFGIKHEEASHRLISPFKRAIPKEIKVKKTKQKTVEGAAKERIWKGNMLFPRSFQNFASIVLNVHNCDLMTSYAIVSMTDFKSFNVKLLCFYKKFSLCS